MKRKLSCSLILVLIFVVAPLHAALAQSPTPQAPAVSAQRVVERLIEAGMASASLTPMTRADYEKAPFVCKGMKFAVTKTELPVHGRAFYCARKADGDRLERYYAGVSSSGQTPMHVLTQRPFVVVLDGATSVEIVEKYRAALPRIIDGSFVATADVQISVKVGALSYMRWGKPLYMNDPKSSCTTTDDSHAVLMLKVPVDITNNSSQTMQVGSWRGIFYRYDGSPATTCYFSASGRQTKDPLKNEWDRAAATRTAQDKIESREAFSIPPGSTASLTYAVFVEINERVAYGEITDAVLGKSNRIEIPSTVPVP